MEYKMSNQNNPFYPIIYVRGYAMTQGDIDETAADPFCGYNAGSTIFRAVAGQTKTPRKFVFESPVVRLSSDFKYGTTYSDGYELSDDEWQPNQITGLPLRCVVILRYYDNSSALLGGSAAPHIPDAADQLNALVLKLRDKIMAVPNNGIDSRDDFRCYLVAHSMGGLVCRAFLQSVPQNAEDGRKYVDKFFTYATPHNGIDVAGINVPKWFSKDAANNFNRSVMAEYLNLEDAHGATGRVDWLPPGPLAPERVFCMVGTNRSDYEAAMGASRTFVGQGSDGLVRIENATLTAINADDTPGIPCSKAFTYRSHSGYFGIINGEESYQNLTRFLFGDVKVDVWVDIDSFSMPSDVEVAAGDSKKVNALYQFELLAAPRGKPWYLSRRIAEEDSVACLTHQDWIDAKGTKSLFLSTVFLSNLAKMDPKDPTLAYAVTLGIRVPDYEIDGVLWMKQHFEGGYLYRKTFIIRLSPPAGDSGWTVAYDCPEDSQVPTTVKGVVPGTNGNPGTISIDFENSAKPGVKGRLKFAFSPWNVGRIQPR
jgi:hypothetical protein